MRYFVALPRPERSREGLGLALAETRSQRLEREFSEGATTRLLAASNSTDMTIPGLHADFAL